MSCERRAEISMCKSSMLDKKAHKTLVNVRTAPSQKTQEGCGCFWGLCRSFIGQFQENSWKKIPTCEMLQFLGFRALGKAKTCRKHFRRTLKSQCGIAFSSLGNRCDFWVCDGHRNRKNRKTRCDFGALRLSLSAGCPSGRGSEKDFLEVAFSSYFLGILAPPPSQVVIS